MAFGAYSELVKRFPMFADSALDTRVLLDELETQANRIKTRLRKSFSTFPISSSGSILATGNLAEDETITIGDRVFRFKGTPALVDDIDIGTTKEISLANLESAIESTDNGGYFTGTGIHTAVKSVLTAASMALSARKAGESMNTLALSSSSGNITTTSFSGGLNEVALLTSLDIWQTVLSLLAGKAISAASGTGNKPLILRLEKQIVESWETLDVALYLFTVAGGEISADSMCPVATEVTYG